MGQAKVAEKKNKEYVFTSPNLIIFFTGEIVHPDEIAYLPEFASISWGKPGKAGRRVRDDNFNIMFLKYFSKKTKSLPTVLQKPITSSQNFSQQETRRIYLTNRFVSFKGIINDFYKRGVYYES